MMEKIRMLSTILTLMRIVIISTLLGWTISCAPPSSVQPTVEKPVMATNYALSFTAANEDYVDCGNDPELQMGSHDLTVEFWLKTSASGVQRIVGNGGSGASDDGYSIWILRNGKIRAGLSDGTTSDGKQNNSTVVNDGNWHHCAVVFERDDKLRVYVDGSWQGKPFPGVNNCDNTNDTCILGRKSTTNSAQSYTGSLDEVRIWNTALSRTVIADWRNKEVNDSHPNISDLQAYYKYNESSDTTANDVSRNV
jgi:hypothetical protein